MSVLKTLERIDEQAGNVVGKFRALNDERRRGLTINGGDGGFSGSIGGGGGGFSGSIGSGGGGGGSSISTKALAEDVARELLPRLRNLLDAGGTMVRLQGGF